MEKKIKVEGKKEKRREYLLEMKQTLQLMFSPFVHYPEIERLKLFYKISVTFENVNYSTLLNRIIRHFAYMFIPGIPGPPKAFSGGLIAPP